ncbi:F-box domain containing protein [Colletotrichum musicola]|uniref:F-box domain containing protein n=1 Tax=Colletotrichum musicola TaxID=2175873 RepID=A0A8H6K3I4_9PEZI|nr:F-box domain containing protein [Colletotrichum musicola]
MVVLARSGIRRAAVLLSSLSSISLSLAQRNGIDQLLPITSASGCLLHTSHSPPTSRQWDHLTPDFWSSVPPLFRIKVAEADDIEASYPLLASYATNPDAALTVNEFGIDTDRWPSRWFGCRIHDEAPNDPVRPVDDAAHRLLEDRARSLGLSQASTDSILNALSWKKAHLLGQGPETPRGFREHNFEYACAAATLLLSFCKNITQVYWGQIGSCIALEEYLHKSNYGILPAESRALQQLKTVRIMSVTDSLYRDTRTYRRSECLRELSYFHRLPRFTTFVLDAFGDYQMHHEIFAPKSSSPSFKRIQMRRTGATGSIIGMLLRAPLNLEELVLSTGGLWLWEGDISLASLKGWHKSLLMQKDSLKVLDMDVGAGIWPYARGEGETGWEGDADGPEGDEDEEWGWILEDHAELRQDEYFAMDEALGGGPLYSHELPDTRPYGYTIGSFHDFPKLTHLSITLRAFMGPGITFDPSANLTVKPPFRLFEALPPNLEYLCFYDYDKGVNADIDDHVREFMEKKGELFPSLREVVGVDEKVPAGGTLYKDVGYGNNKESRLFKPVDPEFGWAVAI